MGNISKKAAALQAILEQNGMLQKTAEKIEHIASPENLKSVVRNQQKEIEEGTDGNYASASDATPIPAEADELDTIEGSSKTPAKADMKNTGTTINQITTDGCPQGTPAEVSKTAALKQKLNACVRAEMSKMASAQAANAANQHVTATEVIHKVAALAQLPDGKEADALAADIDHDFAKLAAYNDLFAPACERVAFRKMAEEIDALADAEGISDEDAAAALDASMENDPEAQEEFNNEVEGEAVSDLADDEAEAMGIMGGLEDTAAQLSETLGTPIEASDIVDAVEQVVEQAEEMGVEPEALIQAAADEMVAGNEDISDEDSALADQLIEEAAANGVSPEELLQVLAEDEGMGEEEAAAADEEMPKEASLHTLTKVASTKRGANLARILQAVGR